MNDRLGKMEYSEFCGLIEEGVKAAIKERLCAFDDDDIKAMFQQAIDNEIRRIADAISDGKDSVALALLLRQEYPQIDFRWSNPEHEEWEQESREGID